MGYLFSREGRRLTPERIDSISGMPIPKTQKGVRGIIGMASYCRQWTANFAMIVKPMGGLTKKDAVMPLQWNEECQRAFDLLKTALCSAQVLGTPNYEKMFRLFVHGNEGCTLAVLTQEQGGRNRPCGYFISALDPVSCTLPQCLRAVAAAAASVKQTEGMVLGHTLILMVQHAIDVLLNRTQTQHLTSARLTRYEIVLFAPHIQIMRSSALNPAELMRLSNEEMGENESSPHDCLMVTEEETKGRIDLTDTPQKEPDGELFCDGSCFKLPDGTSTAAYAITTQKSIVESKKIPYNSAQAAEIIALTRACEISENLSVSIYTDSQYAFGVLHNFVQLWAERGFLTSHGTRIQYGPLIVRLLSALTCPKRLAIVKCKAHKK